MGLSVDDIGAYAHKKVAIAFATWCSPEFFSVVIDWTEAIITKGGFVREDASIDQLEALKIEINDLLAEKERLTKLNGEVAQIDAKLVFIVKIIVQQLARQAADLGSMVMSAKREKAYYDYWQVIYALNNMIPKIFSYDCLHTKQMLEHSMTDEKITELFNIVALKGCDLSWEVNYKNYLGFNMSEN